MEFWGPKPEPRPKTVKGALGKFYEALEDLEYVVEVNLAEGKEAREKAEDLRAKAKWQDNEADDREAEASQAKGVMENVRRLLGLKK